MKTEQQIFDQVAKHLLKQMRKSYLLDSATACAYRGEQGTMCAVGCLLTEYDPGIERKTVYVIFRDYPEIAEAAGINKDHIALITRLQTMHDFRSVDGWFDRLAEIAKEFKLDPKVLIEVAIC